MLTPGGAPVTQADARPLSRRPSNARLVYSLRRVSSQDNLPPATDDALREVREAAHAGLFVGGWLWAVLVQLRSESGPSKLLRRDCVGHHHSRTALTTEHLARLRSRNPESAGPRRVAVGAREPAIFDGDAQLLVRAVVLRDAVHVTLHEVV